MKYLTRRINEWLIVLLSFASIIVVFSFIRGGEMDFLLDKLPYLFNPSRNSIIIGLNTIAAIDIFKGSEPQAYSFSWEIFSILTNVILYLMVGPFLLFKGYKKVTKAKDYAKPWYWYVGAIICLSFISVIPRVVMHIDIFENGKELSSASRNKDMMRAEIFDVGFATAEYEILEDGITDSFTVAELNLSDLVFEYSIENIESDTLITLIAASSKYKDHSVTIDVRPYNKKVLTMRN